MIAIMSASNFFLSLETACGPGAVRVVSLQAGEALFRQDGQTPGLPMVLEGRIDLIRWTRSGHCVRIHCARAGEIFAEASLYAEACHCDAVAATPSFVKILSKRAILGTFDTSPGLLQMFVVQLAGSLVTARRLLELRAITPLTERFMARLAELVDQDGHLPEHLALTSIAEELGVSPPALYRAIAALERSGLVDRPGHGRVRLLKKTVSPKAPASHPAGPS